MTKKRFKIIPAVYLYLIKNNKILMQRRFNTGYEDGNYSLVAGHLDGGETCREALVREVKEEANITLSIRDLKVVHVVHRKADDHERVDFFVKANKWQGDPKIMEPHKCDDLKWFALKNLPKNIIPYVKFAINKIQNKVFYSEFGW
ncbi:NUDIX hydrolase [bacterium]|nr:NUDIX hydrolase [bacterium]|tara:strand:- start:9750 stop:10187 length:438 start_codon:yes stop_codon:yes gene_type:complete